MKKFENLNFYEILGVPLTATYYEIKIAYKEEIALYNENSISTYSFFSDDERDEILEKIEEAFLTLIDDDKRADYDKVLVNTGQVQSLQSIQQNRKMSKPIFQTNKTSVKQTASTKIQEKVQQNSQHQTISDILNKDIITGADLKEIRECLEIHLEDVYEITRISLSTLQAIENDNPELLPPKVHLKNFLRTIADLYGITPSKIVDGYFRKLP